jgi:hypothetical protein
VERLLNYKLLIIFFLFLIFDFEVGRFLDERAVSLFLRKNKDIKNLKLDLKRIYKLYWWGFYIRFSIFLFSQLNQLWD